MVALSIMALVLVGVFHLQSQNVALGVRARFNAIAPMLAGRITTEIISDPDALTSPDSGDFGDDFPGYSWASEVSDVESEYLEETARRLKKIDVYVEALDQLAAYHLRTYFFFDTEP